MPWDIPIPTMRDRRFGEVQEMKHLSCTEGGTNEGEENQE